MGAVVLNGSDCGRRGQLPPPVFKVRNRVTKMNDLGDVSRAAN